MPGPLETILKNLHTIQNRIADAARHARRPADQVTIVAVTKTHPPEIIRAAYAAGLRQFGENRVQEFETKLPQVSDLPETTWHLIGHLQSNKAARAARLFHRIDSVDSISLAQKLDIAAGEENKTLGVLIEVHLGGEASKSGVSETDLPALAESVISLRHLKLHGLMTIPPFSEQAEDVRPFFRKLRHLRDDLEKRLSRELPVLSMGMSHDFDIAVEEGATEIRPGTALFGERPKTIFVSSAP
jgi:pyridoxal phosphate enzyme (YggS family)